MLYVWVVVELDEMMTEKQVVMLQVVVDENDENEVAIEQNELTLVDIIEEMVLLDEVIDDEIMVVVGDEVEVEVDIGLEIEEDDEIDDIVINEYYMQIDEIEEMVEYGEDDEIDELDDEVITHILLQTTHLVDIEVMVICDEIDEIEVIILPIDNEQKPYVVVNDEIELFVDEMQVHLFIQLEQEDIEVVLSIICMV